MRFLKLILLLCYCILHIRPSEAVGKFFDLAEVKNWRIIAEIEEEKKICHAIMTPYRDKLLYGNINNPKFIVSYKGHLAYSISFSALTRLAHSKSVTLFVNDSQYTLKVNKHGKNAITYSADQDVDIINDIISGPYPFKIRSKGAAGELGFIYFSSIGLQEAISYMEKNCSKL
ncbi:MAG: hypothetical protein MRQ07_04155 [Candidatus Midichloria sp.]|nr:hypothetical protein [Candidatus Midichloria sp.]